MVNVGRYTIHGGYGYGKFVNIVVSEVFHLQWSMIVWAAQCFGFPVFPTQSNPIFKFQTTRPWTNLSTDWPWNECCLGSEHPGINRKYLENPLFWLEKNDSFHRFEPPTHRDVGWVQSKLCKYEGDCRRSHRLEPTNIGCLCHWPWHHLASSNQLNLYMSYVPFPNLSSPSNIRNHNHPIPIVHYLINTKRTRTNHPCVLNKRIASYQEAGE